MGCFTRGLIVLIVLVLIIGGAWFFAVQPYLSSIAQSRLDNVLTQAVNNIPEQISLLPDGPVKIPQEALNNLLVLESSPSDIIQNPQVSITPDLARFTFQVYGFNCAATGQLAVSKGKLIATNVNIEGIAALILTPDQVAAAVNRHFADAEVKIKHSITAARLANQELDLTLGPPLAGSGQPSGTPTTIPTSIPTSIPSAVPSAISTLIP